MEPIRCDLEPEGLETLLVGLRFPAYADNRLFKALYVALTIEWMSRETKDYGAKAVALTFIGELTDVELHEAGGLFDGLCGAMTRDESHKQYPRTFAFCTDILDVVVQEMTKRPASAQMTLQ